MGDIITKLGYFELMEYTRKNPDLFRQDPRYQWTERQKWEFEGPRGRRNDAAGSLWKRRPDLLPVPAATSNNPFEPHQVQQEASPIRNEETIDTRDVREIVRSEVCVSEQDDVITTGGDVDMLVVAPPGTGKTHTLVERMAYLVAQRLVDNPREQILALSFTRSAVAELRKRLIAKARAGGSDALHYVKIQTFDSLATSLLRLDLDPDEIVSGFSERIIQFNLRLAADQLPESHRLLSKVRFLLVDEVQDLNGPRARMVLAIAALVSRNNGCSMFLGDPAQAIYDFEQQDVNDAFTSVEFLQDLSRGSYGDWPPVRKEYSNYRRFETQAMLEFVRSARSAMGVDGLTPDGSRLDELLGTLGDPTPLSTVVDAFDQKARTALLTRDNLEAYWLWEWLRDQGISAELWRGAKGGYWPGWVARLFLGYQGDSISIERTRQRWDTHIAHHVAITFPQAMGFLQLQGLMEDDAESIQVSAIADRIANSAPITADGQATARLIISTIHRSKGLEFDDVLLLAPKNMHSAEEIRVVYVAATRAKRSLRVLKRDNRIVRSGSKNGRSLRTSNFPVFNFPQSPHVGLLVDGFDVVAPESLLSLEEPLMAQKQLWDECAGRTRTMQIDDVQASVGTTVIGGLAKALAVDLAHVRRFRQSSAGAIGDLRIIDLATVTFPPTRGQVPDVLGAARVALVPVVTGIISI